MPAETCVIPVGGKGSRMGDLTNDRPKCLLEIDGRTLLERVVLFGQSQGCARFVKRCHSRLHGGLQGGAGS